MYVLIGYTFYESLLQNTNADYLYPATKNSVGNQTLGHVRINKNKIYRLFSAYFRPLQTY